MVNGLHGAQEPVTDSLTVNGSKRRTISYPVSCELPHHAWPTFFFVFFFFHSLSLSRSVFVRNSPTPPHISPLWRIEVDLGFAKLYPPAVSKDTLYVSAVLLNCHGAT